MPKIDTDYRTTIEVLESWFPHATKRELEELELVLANHIGICLKQIKRQSDRREPLINLPTEDLTNTTENQ